jgi:hypothetical protein
MKEREEEVMVVVVLLLLLMLKKKQFLPQHADIVKLRRRVPPYPVTLWTRVVLVVSFNNVLFMLECVTLNQCRSLLLAHLRPHFRSIHR